MKGGWTPRRRLESRLDSSLSFDRTAQLLFAAQISLRRLNEDAAEQELNLVKFPAG
jgi:hypothetical protein